MVTVAYRGNFQPDLPDHKKTSTENQLAWTLEKMGHRVHRLQENAVDWPVVKVIAEQADLFLWTKTWNVDPAGGFDALDWLADRGIPTVGYHLDLFWGINRQAQIGEDPYWRTQWTFTADGGHDDDWARAGVNHVWAEPAIYEPDAIIGTPSELHGSWPILFVGSHPYPHAEHKEARRDIIQTLSGGYGRNFRLFTTGIRGRDLADLYAGSTIVVGDSCLAGQVPRYWSDRIPETIGRGGFLIHPHVDGIEGSYTDGTHLRTYQAGDMHALRALVDHYLVHPDEAAAIGLSGRSHVLTHHTYRHRMERMLDVVLEKRSVAVA